MEVLNDLDSLLSDFEVRALVHELNEGPTSRKGKQASLRQPANLLTVLFEVKNYLGQRPAAFQTAQGVDALLKGLARFPLTKAERLQILNQRPSTLVELHVLIAECDERFDERQMNEMLALVAEHLPAPPAPAPTAPAADETKPREATPTSAPAGADA